MSDCAPTTRRAHTCQAPAPPRGLSPQPACAPSDLGYQCSRPLGSGLVLHWTAGGAAPPANPCTSGGLQSPAPADGPPLLHLAATSPLAGYIALAFAARAGQMAPAQAVAGSTSDSGEPRVAALSLLSYTQVREVSPLWATNAAVVRSSAGGLLLCFSVAASGLPGAAAHRRGRALAQSSAAPVLEVSGAPRRLVCCSASLAPEYGLPHVARHPERGVLVLFTDLAVRMYRKQDCHCPKGPPYTQPAARSRRPCVAAA